VVGGLKKKEDMLKPIDWTLTIYKFECYLKYNCSISITNHRFEEIDNRLDFRFTVNGDSQEYSLLISSRAGKPPKCSDDTIERNIYRKVCVFLEFCEFSQTIISNPRMIKNHRRMISFAIKLYREMVNEMQENFIRRSKAACKMALEFYDTLPEERRIIAIENREKAIIGDTYASKSTQLERFYIFYQALVVRPSITMAQYQEIIHDDFSLDEYYLAHCPMMVALAFLLQRERIMLMQVIIEQELVMELAPSLFWATFVGRYGGTIDDVIKLIK
jgi:hypothetical protein